MRFVLESHCQFEAKWPTWGFYCLQFPPVHRKTASYQRHCCRHLLASSCFFCPCVVGLSLDDQPSGCLQPTARCPALIVSLSSSCLLLKYDSLSADVWCAPCLSHHHHPSPDHQLSPNWSQQHHGGCFSSAAPPNELRGPKNPPCRI